MANNHRPARSLITAHDGPTRVDWASPQQRAGFEYGPAPLALSGGYGAAKTYTGCLKALFISDLYPRNRGVIARRKWVDLKDTTMTTFFKICKPSAYMYGRRSDQQKILQLNNGSEILWLHLDDPEQENIIQGIEINWFLIDQAEEVEEEIFDKLSARLGRWDQARVPQYVKAWYEEVHGQPWPWVNDITGATLVPTYSMLTCNPDVLTHWIYRRFHPESPDHSDRTMPDPHDPDNGALVSYRDLGYHLINMPSLSNKHLPKQNRAQLLARGRSFVNRYVKGKWGQVEGTIHAIDEKSLLAPTEAVLSYIFREGERKYYRSFDHGEFAPACMTGWVMDEDGNHFCFLEYYKGDQLVSEHRKNIYRITEEMKDAYGSGLPGFMGWTSSIADPSIFNKTKQTQGGRYSVSDEYEDTDYDPDTAIFWDRGDNDELGTRNRINELLAIDPDHKHPITGDLGAPRLYFIRHSPSYPYGCSKVTQETESQRREKIGTYLGQDQFSDERDEAVVDHAYDTVRYYVASHNSPIRKRKKRRTAGTFKAAQDLMRRANRRRMRKMSHIEAREAHRYGRV